MTSNHGAPPRSPTLRVLIVETPPDYTIDGVAIGGLRIGAECELPRNIAEVLLAMQIAVLPIVDRPWTVRPGG